MIRILSLSFILLGTLFCDPIVLSYQNIDQDSGYLEIHYSSENQISGFQMNLTGVTIESASSDLSFVEFSPGSGFVLGYLGGSGYLPASDDNLLFSIEFTPQGESLSCLENIIIAGAGGASFDVDEVECVSIPSAYIDCSGEYAGPDLPEENSDCDGNCAVDLDCNGDCAGRSVAR